MAHDTHQKVDPISGMTTTGHSWDNIEELNHPLPRWWLWTFYLTIIWSIGYFIVYPAWPLVTSYTKGVFGLQNTTPLVREDGVGPEAEEALNKVSAQLTTEALLEMMKKVAVDKTDPAKVAAEWLDANPV